MSTIYDLGMVLSDPLEHIKQAPIWELMSTDLEDMFDEREKHVWFQSLYQHICGARLMTQKKSVHV